MANPYELWDMRKSLGVMRDVDPVSTYWMDLMFPNLQIDSTDEWIDFEKLPAHAHKMAPFVRPLGSGKPIYEDRSSGFRFKPAYIKLKDAIDPVAPLVRRPGVDASMLNPSTLNPNQRRELLRAAMTVQHVNAIEQTWEWMAARASIDAKVTIEGEEYPAVELDFRRAANHTVTKTAGNFWGDAGISIFDDIQTYADRMWDAEFGGFPTRMTFGSKVWQVIRQDEEMLKHMDTNLRDPRATIERALIGSDDAVKVGELQVGGSSGATIEMWLYRGTYTDYETKVETPMLAANKCVFTGTADKFMGYRCFGAIIDPYANYQSLPIFPRNWMEKGDPAVEHLLHQSAPLFVPVNPNVTLTAEVVAA